MCSAVSGYSEILVKKQPSDAESISIDQIALMVENIKAEAITDLCEIFANLLLERCNPIAAEEIERLMFHKYPENKDQKRVARNTAIVAADYKTEGERPIFSPQEQIEFNSRLLCLLEHQIRSHFSLPLAMIEKGLEIQFTDLEPQGILLQILQETDLQLPPGYFPTHYKMKLMIDQEETTEKNQLVFSLQEICQKTTIRGKKFDLDQLKEADEEAVHSDKASINECPLSPPEETSSEIEKVFKFLEKWHF